MFNQIKQRFPSFDNVGLLEGSKLEPIQDAGFCLVFRHDMDDITDVARLATFLEMDAALGVQSTCFFRLGDAIKYPDMCCQMQEMGYEVQLHSEARPSMILATPSSWRYVPTISVEGYLFYRYKTNLERQKHRFKEAVNVKVTGHSPHATNNYLYFNTYMNWSIIERATVTAAFDYMCDWRLPSRTAENEEFPNPLPPRWHVVDGVGRSLILSTAWDDKVSGSLKLIFVVY